MFTHISPMLAKNFHYDMARIVPSFQGRAFCMDVKLDGERMMCHKEGDTVRCHFLFYFISTFCFLCFVKD